MLGEAIKYGGTLFLFMVLHNTYYKQIKVKLPMYLHLADGTVQLDFSELAPLISGPFLIYMYP